MLRRKVYNTLMDWKDHGDKPLLITGQRQVGKTYIVEHFAKENFDTYIYANLNEEGSFRDIFKQKDRTIDNIVLSIKVLRQIKDIDPKRTLIFLDEIQDCSEALSALKTFRKDGRYRVIASGSMLGVTHRFLRQEDDEEVDPLSPMGDVKKIRMTSMDFEEFLWANAIPQDAIDHVRDCIKARREVSPVIHETFSKMFRIFQITGGMPASVQAYVDDKGTFSNSSEELEDIISEIGRDITKYNTPGNAIRTMECFESVPYQLAETNKKFHYSRVSPSSVGSKNTRKAADKYMENLLWIKSAGYGNFCYALDSISSPLNSHVKKDVFKVYLSDTGLLSHMYGDLAVKAIFTSDTSYNRGSLTENIVAECLMKCGCRPYYYVNNNGSGRMEIDFVLEMFSGMVAIEVKSGKDRDSPSIGTVSKYFSINRRIMLEDDNVHISDDGIEHFPLYASAFFDTLDDRPGYI